MQLCRARTPRNFIQIATNLKAPRFQRQRVLRHHVTLSSFVIVPAHACHRHVFWNSSNRIMTHERRDMIKFMFVIIVVLRP